MKGFTFIAPAAFATLVDATTLPPPASTIGPTLCSCSPRQYDFELNLNQSCDVDDLEGQPGIGLTFCFLGSFDARRRELESIAFVSFNAMAGEEFAMIEQYDLLQMTIFEEIEVISIQFLEFDTSGELIVINQDDTYANTSLSTGDVVTFKSIANNLDADVPIEDQLDLLPGGVQVTIRGKVVDPDTGEETIVSNRITWSYSNACDAEHMDVGDSIGWVTVDGFIPASKDFCPSVSTTTTTEAPTTTTETTTTTTTETSTAAPFPTEPPISTPSPTRRPTTNRLCEFCPEGLTGNDPACESAVAYAKILAKTDPICDIVQLGEFVCCSKFDSKSSKPTAMPTSKGTKTNKKNPSKNASASRKTSKSSKPMYSYDYIHLDYMLDEFDLGGIGQASMSMSMLTSSKNDNIAFGRMLSHQKGASSDGTDEV